MEGGRGNRWRNTVAKGGSHRRVWWCNAAVKAGKREGSFSIWRQWLINSAVESGSSGRWRKQKAETGGSDGI